MVHTIPSLSVFGSSIFYAAFTGFLLWASSMIAAWTDNWFVCHRVGEALEINWRLRPVLGTSRTLRCGRFWSKNIAGLAGNISFGFMLGLIPEQIKHYESRSAARDAWHVTVLQHAGCGGCLPGTPHSGHVAVLTGGGGWHRGNWIHECGYASPRHGKYLRARHSAPERHAMYGALWQRMLREPSAFILPIGVAGHACTRSGSSGEAIARPTFRFRAGAF